MHLTAGLFLNGSFIVPLQAKTRTMIMHTLSSESVESLSSDLIFYQTLQDRWSYFLSDPEIRQINYYEI